jgi:hypothetical protein
MHCVNTSSLTLTNFTSFSVCRWNVKFSHVYKFPQNSLYSHYKITSVYSLVVLGKDLLRGEWGGGKGSGLTFFFPNITFHFFTTIKLIYYKDKCSNLVIWTSTMTNISILLLVASFFYLTNKKTSAKDECVITFLDNFLFFWVPSM